MKILWNSMIRSGRELIPSSPLMASFENEEEEIIDITSSISNTSKESLVIQETNTIHSGIGKLYEQCMIIWRRIRA